MVAGLRHGRARPAAPVLATAALTLAMGGTLLTRSGAAPSVHAFGEDRAVGWALLAVLLAVAAATVVALAQRPVPVPAIDPAPGRGREALAVAAQPWLAAFAIAVVLLGTVRPLVGDDAVAVDGSYYASLLAPGGLAALALLLRFRPTHLAHLAVLVLAIGLTGSTRSSSGSATLAEGEALRVAGWEVRNDGVRLDGDRTVAVDLAVLRDGDERTHLEPSLVAFPERGVLLAETSLRSTPLTDVQVVLRDADDDGRALVEVHVRPLVWFVWWGGLLLGASALWWAGAGGGMRDARIRP
jgi:cytochrome c biogenesis factor